jgi:radical SAM superfamily enzyme YgiQ (UPF0313 family)
MRISETLTADDFMLFAKAGVSRIRFGVDGWTDETLKHQGKGYSMDAVRRNLLWCKDSGIVVDTNWVIGCPGESRELFVQSMLNILELKPFIFTMNNVNPCMTLPNSRYAMNPEKFGIKTVELHDHYDSSPNSILAYQWVSENPHLDHKIRMERCEEAMKFMEDNGIKTSEFNKAEAEGRKI